MVEWYERPIHRRAVCGGEIGLDGKFYKGGELMPFYVPRPIMPQINQEDYPEFLAFADACGVKYVQHSIDPHILHPHQRIDPLNLKKILEAGVENKPALVSEDFYVLDGNHRWMLHLQQQILLPSIQLRLPFEQGIELMFRFPKTYELKFHPEID